MEKRTLNTLAKEGITPSGNPMITGSTFAKSGKKKSNDQQRTEVQLSQKKAGKRDTTAPFDLLNSSTVFLPRNEWLPLGEGWFQATPFGSGASARCGLHSLIESSPGMLFLCVYEPRTKEAYDACTRSSPEYDLEIIIAFKSPTDYVSLACELASQHWLLKTMRYGMEQVIAEVSDVDIKANQFYSLLIQTRGSSLSIDINGTPVFTNVRPPELDSLSGLVGLISLGSKFAVKGWKLRGVAGARPTSRSNSGGGLLYGNVGSPNRVFTPTREMSDYASPRSSSSTGRRQVNNWIASSDGGSVVSGVTSQTSVYGKGDAISSAKSSPRCGIQSLAQLLQQQQQQQQQQQPNPTMHSTHSNSLRPASASASAQLHPISPPHPNIQRTSSAGLRRPSSAAFVSDTQSTISASTISSRQYPHLPFPSSLAGTPFSSFFGQAEGSLFDDSSPRARPFENRLGGPTTTIGGGGPGSFQHCNPSFEERPQISPTSETPTRENLSCNNALAVEECRAKLQPRHEAHVVEMVLRDVIIQDGRNKSVTYNDIAALDTAKRLLHEAIMLPMLMPEFFTGIREPWKGVLLFGPPGTGKTLLARAVCSFNCCTFFSCSSSSLISKYRGESEKIVRCLFEAARLCTPSVVFLDEVDALVSARGMDGEHEASRRLKTEFFAQMDGLSSSASTTDRDNVVTPGTGVMVLATTNCPWDLDEAMRRRLEKRIHIPLPDFEARQELFRICLRDLPVAADVESGLTTLSWQSEGYSGADIHIACREASMMPMRRLLALMDPTQMHIMRQTGELVIPKVTLSDFQQALAQTRPSVSKKLVDKFIAWEKEFGSC